MRLLRSSLFGLPASSWQSVPFSLGVTTRILQSNHNPMKTTINTLILALVAVCGLGAASAIAGDQESIQGTWTLETATVDGMALPNASAEYGFTGETLTMRAGDGKEQKSTFKLDTTAQPKVMVVEHDAKPDRTPYELNGDTLKLAFPPPGEQSKEVSDKGQVLFTLKRKKP